MGIDKEWVYLGESGDIQARLSQHLAEQGTCIKQRGANGFQFELVAAAQRVARQDYWIATLQPTCNQRFG